MPFASIQREGQQPITFVWSAFLAYGWETCGVPRLSKLHWRKVIKIGSIKKAWAKSLGFLPTIWIFQGISFISQKRKIMIALVILVVLLFCPCKFTSIAHKTFHFASKCC